MKKGTSHGFRNSGSTPAAVFEIFVKRSSPSQAARQETDVDGLLLALTGQPAPR